MKISDNLIYIWNDLVGIKDLSISIIISIVLTMGGFFLAPSTNGTKQLFFGLSGAVIAFLINTYLIKPKRTIQLQKID